MHLLRRYWPVLALIVALAIAYAFGLHRQLTWSSLVAHQRVLRNLAALHTTATAAAYVLIYAACVAVSIPGAVWLTIAGGLLFETFFGTIFAVAGASIGAVLIFLIARSTFGGLLARRAEPLLERARPWLERDGFSYLLAVRLLPVVPFWLTNLAPALVGMRLAPYTAATVIGIIPATAVFASVGAGLGDVLGRGDRPDLSIIVSPPVLLPLLGLACLALVPIAWRRWRAARTRPSNA